MLNNINYQDYLSIDNGKGLLINKKDIEILNRYNFNYKNYSNLTNLIFDIDNYLNETYEDTEDLEEVLIRLSEQHYYNEIKK